MNLSQQSVKVTPMMQQYLQIKERYRDAILFFRLGDFYEMFFEDAETASKILDIALTARSKTEESSVPLCGVPYHSAEPYIRKLLDAGHKVAVCEQVEDPRLAKGVVQREVVRVITPGTVTAPETLDAKGNNFLAVIYKGDGIGLAFADITTGEFRFTQLAEEQSLFDEIGRIRPSEILLPKTARTLGGQLQKEFPAVHYSYGNDELFSESAESFGELHKALLPDAARWPDGDRAVSALVGYLDANAPDSLKLLRTVEAYSASHYLIVDDVTRANLELVTSYRGERTGSLLAVLDRTETPMGARRMRQWLLYPLLDGNAISQRQHAVQALVDRYSLRQSVKDALGKIQDLERLTGRALAGNASPRDLVAINDSLRALADVKAHLQRANSEVLEKVAERLVELPQVVELISNAIIDDPPLGIKQSGYIRPGFDAELDDIRSMRTHARDWIAQYEASERRRTGIQSLKVRYNRVFGYTIEITRSHLKAAPADYIRKQTLANGERYITPELKEYEAKVLNSESLIDKLESDLLARVRERVAAHYSVVKETSSGLATLDVLLSLAEVAESNHFTRPRIDESLCLMIREGRHAVVEAAIGRGAFVPNDCTMDPETDQILLLTGPNMAGKSTYMRQVALIVILAQMGGFVPASEANIGIVDRLFTRIGATDALARGESTFMVEMKETAHILRHATRRSLIVLDEVGRGTSTFDGISIASAVAEHLHDSPERPRTLFATHYHELADLSRSKERIKNYSFAVKEWQGEIIFLRNLVDGAASHSYGIHVARLAGLPHAVIQRAREILLQLEEGESSGNALRVTLGEPAAPRQMALFGSAESKCIEELRHVNVSRLTPIEALNVLYRLSEEAKKG
jgi:DNA mismatch repair protein MutS